MIPRKLQIKNFLSYGDDLQTIDFGAYRLICLSGKNGHGKSALLDAMTWALWGQARKSLGSTKADEGLLRLGQDTMVVIFDFELNGITYRIRREYVHTYGKPYSGLEFGILDSHDNSFKPLTDKTIRATQEQIDTIIKLDFDAFINSAFLRQGQSNEFSKKSPKERKDILAAILGLHEYDTVRKLAMEKIRHATQEKNTLVALQSSIVHELQQAEMVEQAVRELDQKLNTLEEKRAQLNIEKQDLENQNIRLAQQQQQQAILQFKYTQLAQEQETQSAVLRTQLTKWRTTHAQSKTTINHEQLIAQKHELSAQLQGYQQTLQTQLQLKQQALQLKETIHTLERTYTQHHDNQIQHLRIANERLHADIMNYTNTVMGYKQQQEIIEKQLSTLNSEIEKIDTLQAAAAVNINTIDTVEQQFMRRKIYYQKFITHGNLLSSQIQSGQEKIAALLSQEQAICPLCEQTISTQQSGLLHHKSITQEHFIQHQLKRLTAVIAQLKKILVEQHAHLTNLRHEKDLYITRQAQQGELVKQKTALTTTLQNLKKTIAQLEEQLVTTQQLHAQQLAQLHLLQADTKKGINADELYQETLIKQKALEQALAATMYDEKQHVALQQQLGHLEQQLVQHTQFIQDYALQTTRKEEIQALCAGLKKGKALLTSLQQELNQYTNLEDTKNHILKTSTTLEAHVHALTSQQHQLLQQKGSFENRLATLAQHRITHAKNQDLLRVCDDTIADYQHIAAATGKDGIQALLIEDAIPEIEQEANDLLAKLTNNQAQLSIESLRDLKKGGTKETLDIKISDAAGIRAYELFSGGEAFRIDFALRIAISKLLARRAGTALQILIIDEGFGSQDDEGLMHIMDAMYKIQDDFQKIIIVSHLPAMKEQFPVHFVVEKKPGGSKVSVIEQD